MTAKKTNTGKGTTATTKADTGPKNDDSPNVPAQGATPPIEDSKEDNDGINYLPRRNEKGDLLIDGAVVHCSASNLPKHDDIKVIDTWHKARGWKGVGYHFFIKRDGTVQSGRPLDDDPYLESEEIGAHVLGANRRTVGICLSGIDQNDFTEAQFNALAETIKKEVLAVNSKAEIYGHNYFTEAKSCPNFPWFEWVKKHFPKNAPDHGPKAEVKK